MAWKSSSTGRKAKSPVPFAEGAAVAFRAVPGMTVEWLQRLVDCQPPRRAALANQAFDAAYSPLALKGVTAMVTSTRGGFVVAIRSDEPTPVDAIVRRARALAPQ